MKNKTISVTLFLIITIALTGCVFEQGTPGNTKDGSPTTGKEKTFQGGIEIILEADVPMAFEVTARDLEAVKTVIENRIDGLGVKEAAVELAGERRIVVKLPPMDDYGLILSTIKQSALLELVDMSGITQSEALAMQDAGTIIVTDLYASGIISSTQQVWHTVLTGASIKDAVVRSEAGRYDVSFELSSEAAKIFEDFTAQHIGNVLAIVIDKKILSAPTINDAIPDGKGIISGNFTQDEANQLAIQLRYGALPVPLKVVETRTISPSE